ncbi:hypothetical protein CEXT_104421 [Caerostris extrusa]|uniref:Uncharacterized protein n=1 Tax=Caerostris extrusa TaxID=172846 RepID=A0AAV4Y5G2_CAEEX|nr:hypothetical protein CEXT_104421 [Caerostris extrusa]
MGEQQSYTVVKTKSYLKDLKKDKDLNRYLASIQEFEELLKKPFPERCEKTQREKDEYSENEKLFKRFEKDKDLNRYLASIQEFEELLKENPFPKGVKNSKGKKDEYRYKFGEKGG